MLRKSLTVATVVGAGSQAVAAGFSHAIDRRVSSYSGRRHHAVMPGLVASLGAENCHPDSSNACDPRRRACAGRALAGRSPRRSAWRHIAEQLEQAAAGVEVVDLGIALRMALMLEGLEYPAQ